MQHPPSVSYCLKRHHQAVPILLASPELLDWLVGKMATVTTQASVAVFRPQATKSRFLAGSSGKLTREFAARTARSNTLNSFKVEAKKGEWLPGLPSPGRQSLSMAGGRCSIGVAGMLLPEVFTKIGIVDVPKWYDAGKAEYFASSSTLLLIEFVLFHYVEIRRWQDIKKPGSVNQDPIFKNYGLPPNEVGYPGGIFNPLNFAPTLEAKEKELANGRSAMLAFLGFVIPNLLQHLSDPWHNTIIQALGG